MNGNPFWISIWSQSNQLHRWKWLFLGIALALIEYVLVCDDDKDKVTAAPESFLDMRCLEEVIQLGFKLIKWIQEAGYGWS
jgi:hypothetical protein